MKKMLHFSRSLAEKAFRNRSVDGGTCQVASCLMSKQYEHIVNFPIKWILPSWIQYNDISKQ